MSLRGRLRRRLHVCHHYYRMQYETQKELLGATVFAARKHQDQRRKGQDRLPYVNHVIEVAEMLARVAGTSDLAILQAALLHDTVEDTDTTFEEIEELFGADVRHLVEEMTDDKDLPKAERKRLQIEHAPGLSDRGKLIKIADKISNIRDIVHRPPPDWDMHRRREYVRWGEAVVAGCRGVNSTLEDLFDDVVAEAWKELGNGD